MPGNEGKQISESVKVFAHLGRCAKPGLHRGLISLPK